MFKSKRKLEAEKQLKDEKLRTWCIEKALCSDWLKDRDSVMENARYLFCYIKLGEKLFKTESSRHQ
ncbi:MAG: hypothetical protein LBI60_05310 [Bacteroidales bacterium]|jgi:hypothetical protein|nr:hypothetical protein [Bacteroidales bacterium]